MNLSTELVYKGKKWLRTTAFLNFQNWMSFLNVSLESLAWWHMPYIPCHLGGWDRERIEKWLLKWWHLSFYVPSHYCCSDLNCRTGTSQSQFSIPPECWDAVEDCKAVFRALSLGRQHWQLLLTMLGICRVPPTKWKTWKGKLTYSTSPRVVSLLLSCVGTLL